MNNKVTIGITNYKKLDTQPILESSRSSILGINAYNGPTEDDLKDYSKEKQEWLLANYPDFFLDSPLANRLINSNQPITKEDVLEIRKKSNYICQENSIRLEVLLNLVDFLEPKDICNLMLVNKTFYGLRKIHLKLRNVYIIEELKAFANSRLEENYINKLMYKSFKDPNFKNDITEVEKLIENCFDTETQGLDNVQKDAIKYLNLTVKEVEGLTTDKHVEAVYVHGYDPNFVKDMSSDAIDHMVYYEENYTIPWSNNYNSIENRIWRQIKECLNFKNVPFSRLLPNAFLVPNAG